MEANKLLENILANVSLINIDDIPNIDLYMDQVTSFMDKHLYCAKRLDEDRVLTKTMINNYAKNELLPSPEKKKYSKDHVLLLTLIYYFKNVMAINDIKKVLLPITEKYFHTENGCSLEDIYKEIADIMPKTNESVRDDVIKKMDISKSSFTSDEFGDLKESDVNYLKFFSFISELCFDIYLKKQLVDALVDTLKEPLAKAEREKKEKKEKQPAK